MRILILVQSIDLPNKSHYKRAMKAQQETWDSVPHPDVDVIYYMPGNVDDVLEGNILRIKCGTHWTEMFWNLAKAMRHMLKHDQSWDYIFKTDNSTYIDKAKLHSILESRPRENYYGGMIFPWKTPGVHGMDFMWGDGYALSRDMVAHVVKCYNSAPLKGKQEDDIVIAQIMQDVAKWDDTLHIAIPMMHHNKIQPGYHAYRCRIDPIHYSPAAGIYSDIDRIIDNDIIMMNQIHNFIVHGQTDNNLVLQEQVQN